MNVCIIQARMGSTRLPGKILKDILGKPMLWHVVERCRASKRLHNVVVATTVNSEDDAVKKFCSEHSIPCFRGSADDVLERYYRAAGTFGADTIVRVTGDCPLIDPHVIDACVEAFGKGTYDYISNINPGPRTFPRGLDTEVFSFAALARAHRNAHEAHEREHVTPYMWENKEGTYRIGPTVTADDDYAANYRLTVDYPEDFMLVSTLYEFFDKNGKEVHIPEIIKFLNAHPEISNLNATHEQKGMK